MTKMFHENMKDFFKDGIIQFVDHQKYLGTVIQVYVLKYYH